MSMVEQYITCKNPKCTGLKGGGYSWRPLNSGPDKCPKCNVPFRASKSQASIQYHGPTDWKVQNSKGRPRPAVSGPPQKPILKRTRFEDSKPEVEDFETLLRKKFEEANEVPPEGLFDKFFPKKPKTPQEVTADCFEAVKKAESELEQCSKKTFDMEAKYDRLCQELVDYEVKVAEQVSKLQAAKQQLQDANQELVRLKAKDPPPQASEIPLPSIAQKVKEAAQAFDPTRIIAEELKKLPVMSKLDDTEAHSIGSTMVNAVRQILLTDVCGFIDRTVTQPAADEVEQQPDPSRPSPPPPTAATADAAEMDWKKDNKRGISELDDAEAFDTEAGNSQIGVNDDLGDFSGGQGPVDDAEKRTRLRTKAADMARSSLDAKAAAATVAAVGTSGS